MGPPHFETALVIAGPLRSPAQMLESQEYGGHTSLHDTATAASLGFGGAPIEGPTHLSQLVPLAAEHWGVAWFERGCVSVHYRNVVLAGERVRAFLTVGATDARVAGVRAEKEDGTPVLTGTAWLGEDDEPSELERRLSSQARPDGLVILDRIRVGDTGSEPEPVRMGFDEHLGALYPFTLREKLAVMTEVTPWYTAEGGASSPWGRALIPLEMVPVLAQYTSARAGFRVREPSVGLFLDQEVRLHAGPLFVDEPYVLTRRVLALGESRRAESYWTRTDVRDGVGTLVASLLLHQGRLKESYAGYPPERLSRPRPG
jgi:hypothetical protein